MKTFRERAIHMAFAVALSVASAALLTWRSVAVLQAQNKVTTERLVEHGKQLEDARKQSNVDGRLLYEVLGKQDVMQKQLDRMEQMLLQQSNRRK
jgi:hypothetical protein